MNIQFIPNNPETREKLVEGTLYLTIYQGATTICRSVYAGNDCWKNPGTQELAKNSVAFFASASVFDIPDFKGWNAEPEDYMVECLKNLRTPISLTETLRDRHRDEEILRCLDLMPHSRPHSKMAEDFERDLFVTMRIWGVSKVYVVQETTTDKNGIPRWDLWFQRDRPEGKECTEHDFQNLLDMSDAEFSRLPYSPNKYVVEEWRKELRNIRSVKKPFPTAPFNSTGDLVPGEEDK